MMTDGTGESWLLLDRFLGGAKDHLVPCSGRVFASILLVTLDEKELLQEEPAFKRILAKHAFRPVIFEDGALSMCCSDAMRTFLPAWRPAG